MKLKNPELHQLFIAMVNLYGIIHSDEIIKILQCYYPEIDKKDIMHYLKVVNNLYRADYFVAKIKNERGKFFLVNSFIEGENDTEIIRERTNKPLYIPDTVEELLKYRESDYFNEKETIVYNNLRSFLYKYYKPYKETKKPEKINQFINFIHFNIKSGLYITNQTFKKEITTEIQVSKENLLEAKKVFEDILLETKMFVNKGYSLNELELISKGELAINEQKQSKIKDESKKYFYYKTISKTSQNISIEKRDDSFNDIDNYHKA